MKKFFVAAAMTIAVAGAAFAQKADDHHAARHGGVFVEGKQADYELVAKPEVIRLYVTDHGKPMDLADVSAKLTLLTGADKQDVELKPAAGALEAKGSFKVGPGTKAVAVVTKGGKALGTARFTVK